MKLGNTDTLNRLKAHNNMMSANAAKAKFAGEATDEPKSELKAKSHMRFGNNEEKPEGFKLHLNA